MAETNISFNNKNYSIDETSLSAPTSALKSHLSTVMNGTGAVVVFDGASYNVDFEKIEVATSEFVTHLRTIAGNGYNVVVDGIEYNIDPTKVQDAIVELEAVLNNLNAPTTNGDGVKLLSLDNLILKDLNGLFLLAEEDK